MEKQVIVDENDKVICSKFRSEITKDDIYRVSALWIMNSKKEILLAQRSFKKEKNPGVWGPAVGGTVSENESYEENMIREAKEEINLENFKFFKGEKPLLTFDDYSFFCQFFYAILDKDIIEFKIQEDELEKLRWFSIDALEKEIKRNPENFVPKLNKLIKYHYTAFNLIDF